MILFYNNQWLLIQKIYFLNYMHTIFIVEKTYFLNNKLFRGDE